MHLTKTHTHTLLVASSIAILGLAVLIITTVYGISTGQVSVVSRDYEGTSSYSELLRKSQGGEIILPESTETMHGSAPREESGSIMPDLPPVTPDSDQTLKEKGL